MSVKFNPHSEVILRIKGTEICQIDQVPLYWNNKDGWVSKGTESQFVLKKEDVASFKDNCSFMQLFDSVEVVPAHEANPSLFET